MLLVLLVLMTAVTLDRVLNARCYARNFTCATLLHPSSILHTRVLSLMTLYVAGEPLPVCHGAAGLVSLPPSLPPWVFPYGTVKIIGSNAVLITTERLLNHTFKSRFLTLSFSAPHPPPSTQLRLRCCTPILHTRNNF